MESIKQLFLHYIQSNQKHMAQNSATKTSEKVPNNYTLCIKGDCPKAATCLRHVAVEMMSSEVPKWSIISPAYLAQTEGECPVYRSAEKVQYARGFVRMIRTLPVNVSEMAMHKLIARFGRNVYYDMRKGKRPIAPAEQEIIRTVVAECGAQQEVVFDSYEEGYQW